MINKTKKETSIFLPPLLDLILFSCPPIIEPHWGLSFGQKRQVESFQDQVYQLRFK